VTRTSPSHPSDKGGVGNFGLILTRSFHQPVSSASRRPSCKHTALYPLHDDLDLSFLYYLSATPAISLADINMPVKTEMPTPFPISRSSNKQTSQATVDVAVDALLDPDALLIQLSSEEKIRLLSGDDMWHTVPVPRLGIPRVRVSTLLASILSRTC
jgi:hypothetical protein